MANPKAELLMAELQKKWPGKVMWGREIPVGPPVSSGSLSLDFATGYGGFPDNRLVEICGKEGTGKTTLALLTMLNALEAHPGKLAVFIDLEHKITPAWLEMIVGREVLEKRLYYVQPTSIEEATNIYREVVSTGEICCVILDSIGGAPTVRRNDDAEVGHFGGNAQGVGEFARSAATLASVHHCLTIGINQTRDDFSGYHGLNTPGGRAWKYAVVLRIELVRGKDVVYAKVDEEKIPVGHTVFAKVRKNGVGAGGRVAMYWFYNVRTEEYGFGVDTLDEMVRLGVKTGVIEKHGGWYYNDNFPEDSKGDRKVQGISGVGKVVRSVPEVKGYIVGEIIHRLKDYGSQVAPITDPDAPVDVDQEAERA